MTSQHHQTVGQNGVIASRHGKNKNILQRTQIFPTPQLKVRAALSQLHLSLSCDVVSYKTIMMYGAFQGWIFIAAAGFKPTNLRFLNQITILFKVIRLLVTLMLRGSQVAYTLECSDSFNKNDASHRHGRQIW